MDFGKDSDGKRDRPRIVEVVGPAGAGKTTLCNILKGCPAIQLGNFPDVRKVASIPFFAWYGFRVLGVVALSHPKHLKELGRREFAWLSILSGWPSVLQRERKKSHDVIVLDQGPVFLLAEMDLFGPPFLGTKQAMGFWQTWYRQWSGVLDAVVWLDAPDECLWQRIRSREKEHMVKDQSAQAVFKFLRDYRHAYQHTFSSLAGDRTCLRVLRFDTSRQTPEEIAAQLCLEFDEQATLSMDR